MTFLWPTTCVNIYFRTNLIMQAKLAERISKYRIMESFDGERGVAEFKLKFGIQQLLVMVALALRMGRQLLAHATKLKKSLLRNYLVELALAVFLVKKVENGLLLGTDY